MSAADHEHQWQQTSHQTRPPTGDRFTNLYECEDCDARKREEWERTDEIVIPPLDSRDASVRQATEEEQEALRDWYMDVEGWGAEEATHNTNACYLSVIEDYITGCPGYAGKILIAVGEAAPSFYTAFRWDDDGWKRMSRAPEVRQFDDREGPEPYVPNDVRSTVADALDEIRYQVDGNNAVDEAVDRIEGAVGAPDHVVNQ